MSNHLFQMPTMLPSASAPRVPSIRVTAAEVRLDISQKESFIVPTGSTLVFDFPLLTMGMFSIQTGQAPQRAFSDDQWTMPDNPAPNVLDSRNSPLFKAGMELPVGVQQGNHLIAAELIATTIGTRTSIEALFAQVASEMNAAGAAGRDVVVAVKYDSIQAVAMKSGNSYRLNFSGVQVIDAPKEMVEFRPQFNAVIEHAKRTPIKLPAPTSFSNPAMFVAPSGTAAGWAPPVAQPPAFGAYPAKTAYQPAPTQPMLVAQAVAQTPTAAAPAWQPPVAPQPATIPDWLQAPQAPMAPPAPGDSGT